MELVTRRGHHLPRPNPLTARQTPKIPAAAVFAATIARPRRLDAPELEGLLAAAQRRTPGYHALFVLLAFTGLRIREALGLTWAGVTGAVDGATLEPRATDRGSPGMTNDVASPTSVCLERLAPGKNQIVRRFVLRVRAECARRGFPSGRRCPWAGSGELRDSEH